MQPECEVGDEVERFVLDDPSVTPQPGVVKAVEDGRIYVVGKTFGMWWDASDTTIGLRHKSS